MTKKERHDVIRHLRIYHATAVHPPQRLGEKPIVGTPPNCDLPPVDPVEQGPAGRRAAVRPRQALTDAAGSDRLDLARAGAERQAFKACTTESRDVAGAWAARGDSHITNRMTMGMCGETGSLMYR